MEIPKYKAIDFFCGGGGMTCGLRQAGIDVIAGIDIDKDAKETYEYNNPGSIFINSELNSSYKCNGIHINNLFKFFVWCEVSKSFTRSII